MTGIVLLGAGRMGQVHAAAIAAADARLMAVYDPATELADRLASRTGAAVAPTAAAAIAHAGINAVVIATPSDTHVELLIEAGKPVLCEKPIAPSLAEARRCVAAIGEKAACA